MKYIKKFEEKILKLADTPPLFYPKIKRNVEWGIKSEKLLKYKKDDIVVFELTQQPYIIAGFNDLSDNQDYWIVNPLISDHGWVCEEELRDATSEEKEVLDMAISAKKFNL